MNQGSKYQFRRKRVSLDGKLRGAETEARKTSNQEIHDSLDAEFGKTERFKYPGGNYKL